MKTLYVVSAIFAVLSFGYLCYANTGTRAECARAEARFESRGVSATCVQVATCVSCTDKAGMLLDYYYVASK